MDQNLKDAAQQGNIEGLYSSIAMDAKILDKIDEIPFVQTPLHIAASEGHTEFAMEIMMLKPSFARKLNQDGFTPIHLALRNDHTQETEVVHRLLDVDEDLVRVQGRGGVTPLHYAAETGNLDLLADFLGVCPKSIEDVTTRRETALHIALENGKIDAFPFLVGWLRRAWFIHASSWEKKLLNWRDGEGNTVLHVAVSRNQTQVVKCLVNCVSVDKNIKNSGGHTALDILQDQMHDGNQEMKDMLCRAGALRASSLPKVVSHKDYLKSPLYIYEKFYIFLFRQNMEVTNDLRSMLLVVATLVVTVTYQAALLSPPGGVWQDNYNPATDQFNRIAPINASGEVSQGPHHAGRVVMSTRHAYPFFILNTLTFFATNLTIITLLPLGFTRFLIIVPLWALFACYCFSTFIIFPTTSLIYLLLLIFASLMFALSGYNWFKRLRQLIRAFHRIAKCSTQLFHMGLDWVSFK